MATSTLKTVLIKMVIKFPTFCNSYWDTASFKNTFIIYVSENVFVNSFWLVWGEKCIETKWKLIKLSFKWFSVEPWPMNSFWDTIFEKLYNKLILQNNRTFCITNVYNDGRKNNIYIFLLVYMHIYMILDR